MKYLDNRQLTLWAIERGVEYRTTAKQGQYHIFIINDRPDNFEVSIDEWGETIHDSVPFASLLEALRAAEAMIEELRTLDYDAHIAELEARHNESVDYEESKRNADPADLDSVHQLLDDISEPLYLLSDFEREFLAVLADSPLDAAFARHLKPDSAAAFENFKEMGFVELAVADDRFHITSKGRQALALPVDPMID